MPTEKTIKIRTALNEIFQKYADYNVYQFDISLLIGKEDEKAERVLHLIAFDFDIKNRTLQINEKDFSKAGEPKPSIPPA